DRASPEMDDGMRDTRVLGIFAPATIGAELADLIRDAAEFHEDGADVVDLDTLTGGPFAEADDDTIALLVRGLTEIGIPTAVTTTRAAVAANAVEHGARWVIDPSGGTADAGMTAVAQSSAAGWVIGPWSTRRADWYGGGDEADAYTDGLVRNIAWLLDAGIRSDRIVLHVGAGISAEDPEPWRMLNHLDRVAALGYPLLIDGRDEILAAMSSEDTAERLGDAAVGLTILAAGRRAWGIRVREVGRVAGAMQRITAPRQHA
ncbi:MAG: dihydropteroate synthase, partial [Microbacteriaceae bacterium]|nr:dihydropteroate synthase [Microbacteriaceae bacterium]